MSTFPGVFEALLLIGLGIGYIVLYLAKREEKELQFIGYLIGSVIIILAIIYLLGNIWVQANMHYPKMKYYKMMQSQMYPGKMQPRMMIPQSPVPAKRR